MQLIGGVVLHQGRIAEMKTGEGKDPHYARCIFSALTLAGVPCSHRKMITSQSKDADWMELYTFLGLTVGWPSIRLRR